ncbi:hypothetical protein BC938DRAFT_473844 [Jimgerdemannia flammicorona]|uniref:C2H2-type domain-containing protein n=1 Tax=Jimgerdemannia flammicorona TaxID=994334 RepID=A0A433QT35_9FUNG|nr:hypothetical protein BC938DRAFT_473844 [Jimgerdemannia flammicorona]
MPNYNYYSESDSASDYSEASECSEADSDSECYYCKPCNRSFVNQNALDNHLAKNSSHNYCPSCKRDFCDSRALDQHLNSAVHRGKTFKCPLCDAIFNTVSGLGQHIENNCTNFPFTRKDIPKLIQMAEKVIGAPNLLTCPRITYDVDSNSYATAKTKTKTSISTRIIVFDSEHAQNGDVYECPLCDRSFGTSASLAQHLASSVHGSPVAVVDADKAWDGSSFGCYLCNRRLFTQNALEQHLNSLVHDAKELWCRGCGHEFKVVSALVHHLESGVCKHASSSIKRAFKYALTSI